VSKLYKLADKLNQLRSSCHIPTFSARHPMIPKLYVMPWKQDMKNRRLLMKAGTPDFILGGDKSIWDCMKKGVWCKTQVTPVTKGAFKSSFNGKGLIITMPLVHHLKRCKSY
uniref:Uncharacterized protein n=1 Tax=Oreochromis niloticus TaxID=8128 RepID=A0A669ERJ3_ORENI